MGSEPVTQDWEVIVSSDLASSLIPRGQLRRTQRPVDDRMIPDGAYRTLADSIGRQDLEDMLLVPAVVRPVGHWWQHRCLYVPLCVLSIGEHDLGLWVDGTPPGVQRMLRLTEIETIERQAEHSRRRLTVTGRDGSFSVWYEADGDASADIWTDRLRARVAGARASKPPGIPPRP